MRAGVVGHVEWVRFAKVERVPTQGEIVHASASWLEPAGGGAVAAVQLLKLAGKADFFVAVGNDEVGRLVREGLEHLDLSVHSVVREEPQRQALTYLDADGERTITLLGPKLHPYRSDPLPWEELAGIDAVYFSAGDPGALRAARQARVLVATARELPTLVEAGVELDALVRSGHDPEEAYEPGQIDPEPRLIVSTRGQEGGSFVSGGRTGTYAPAPLPGPIADAYGAGDSFAAGLAFALARGDEVEEALALASRCGAAAMTGRGAYEGQLRL
ncbi:MAG TPA: PfkB family carbohydrate kinase [Gaiellaceae bacterium]|nr:PfkB family carbohydrate kinase [Gaiellaceae bacterium]